MFTREVPNTGHLAPASLAPALLPLYPLYKGGGMQGTTFTMGVPGTEKTPVQGMARREQLLYPLNLTHLLAVQYTSCLIFIR